MLHKTPESHKWVLIVEYFTKTLDKLWGFLYSSNAQTAHCGKATSENFELVFNFLSTVCVFGENLSLTFFNFGYPRN